MVSPPRRSGPQRGNETPRNGALVQASCNSRTRPCYRPSVRSRRTTLGYSANSQRPRRSSRPACTGRRARCPRRAVGVGGRCRAGTSRIASPRAAKRKCPPAALQNSIPGRRPCGGKSSGEVRHERGVYLPGTGRTIEFPVPCGMPPRTNSLRAGLQKHSGRGCRWERICPEPGAARMLMQWSISPATTEMLTRSGPSAIASVDGQGCPRISSAAFLSTCGRIGRRTHRRRSGSA
jgi:hypothetical protein